MKMEAFKQSVTTIYLEGEKVAVDVTNWQSLEGCNLMMTSKPDGALRLAASLTWEDVDMLMVALSASRSA